MSHNKIVVVTIHQPTSKIFQMFHKAVLLDQGRQAGLLRHAQEMLQYFAAAEHEQHYGAELGACAACGTTRPEFIFDVLETPLRDLSGDIILEENNRGQLVPARRYSPDYWRDKYEAFRLMKDVQTPARRGKRRRRSLPEPSVASRCVGGRSGSNSAFSSSAPFSARCATMPTFSSRCWRRRCSLC